jgi:hypothetical protein
MSAIDQIMDAIQQAADAMDDCLDDGLRTLIAAAIAEARREGAEQMREAIAHQAEINALYGVHGTTVSTIRAMPLPDDSWAHGERHDTATPGQRAAQLAAVDEFYSAKKGGA